MQFLVQSSYVEWKRVVDSFGPPDRVFYKFDQFGAVQLAATVDGNVHGVSSHVAAGSDPPTQAQLLVDFPNALEANVNSLTY